MTPLTVAALIILVIVFGVPLLYIVVSTMAMVWVAIFEKIGETIKWRRD